MTFVLCFALGLALVAWRAWSKAGVERARAQAELRSRAAAVQTQFSRAFRAAETLGTLARQSNGSFPNFSQAAGLLYAANPELASLEWQPGGLVSDIVPRNGNQRAIGLNVLKDPSYQAAANAALQSGTNLVALPVPLYRGDMGIVVRLPIPQVNRAGENRFGGFVAVSMSLSQLLRPASLEELPKLGYDYALTVPGSALGKAVLLGRSGNVRPDRAVVQTVRLQNQELRFALQRRGGWIHTSRVLFECVAALLGSLTVSALVSALASRKQSSEALMQANQLLAQETAQRRKFQEELLNERTSRESASSKLQTDLDLAVAGMEKQKQSLREMTEKLQSLEAAFHTARAEADELQARLEKSAKSHEKELAEKQEELVSAQAKLKSFAEQVKVLQSSLAKAEQARETAESTLRTEETKAREALEDLQAKFDAQKSAASKTAAASVARLKEAGEVIQDLETRLSAAEKTRERVAELETPGTEPKPEPSQRPAQAAVLPKPRRPRRRDQDQIELFSQDAPESARRGVTPEERAHEPSDGSEAPDREPTESVELPETSRTEQEPEPDSEHGESKGPAAAERKATPRRPLDVTELRRVVHEIFPLLVDRDPGARDCFKANRAVFRSAFVPAAYDEFEHLVRESKLEEALDRLTRLARKHGINV